LTPRIDAHHQSDMYTQAVNNPANLIEAYTVGHARLGWRSANDEWEAAVEATNVTNELYFLNIFEQYDSSGTVAGTPGPPRMYALTFNKNF